MMKKGKATKVIVNSVLFAAIIALGVTVYQAGNSREQEEYQGIQEPIQIEDQSQDNGDSLVDAGTSSVEAEIQGQNQKDRTEDLVNMEAANNSEYVSDGQFSESETVSNSSVEAELGDSLLSQVDFTEETLMQWPVEGSLLMDYNMDQTVYFKTLNQYKVSPAIAVQAEEGTPVSAAVTGTVTSITEDAETGTTVTMDLGNGYEAVYGQLTDLNVAQGQTVDTGAVLGTVAAPTKYYALEGSNLYFAMRKDGEPIDPLTYLP